MWPSAPAFRSFGNVACPSGASCHLPYCIFSHDASKTQTANGDAASNTESPKVDVASKRRKLNDTGKEPPQDANEASAQIPQPQVFVGLVPSSEASATKRLEERPASSPKQKELDKYDLLPTATRPISPPPKQTQAKAPAEAEEHVRLTPRKLQKEPATFARRLTMLKQLHKYMSLRNDEMRRAVNPEIKALHLSENQLNKLAVEEEEKIGKENGPVYENILKQRMLALSKMTPGEWVKSRREALRKESTNAPKKEPQKRVNTGLTSEEEVIFLSTLTAPQASLEAHGFVTKPPTEAELEETKAAQIAAQFWEVCDRCGTRFQVFPDRREADGALTTGGKCQHHWGKRIFPKRVKGQPPESTRFSCCNEPVGSPGCMFHETHVYKVSEAKRMSLTMPFIETPENDKAEPHTAVCFDCEMGYTTHGLELLRLTAVSWPSHRPLVDVLVRPLGHLLDVNTRFSGVTTQQMLDAKPYDPQTPKPIRKDIRIVDSPYMARDLFLTHVSPTTPILGHALENDLNVIRLIHPTIVDTVILYPTRNGLPFRHGLKTLAKWHLGIDIQQAGAAGHDSYEDAKTTGELIRFKIAEKWKKLKDEGWTIRNDGVYPPVPEGLPPKNASPPPSMIGTADAAANATAEDQKTSRKRPRSECAEGDGTSEAEPPKKRQA